MDRNTKLSRILFYVLGIIILLLPNTGKNKVISTENAERLIRKFVGVDTAYIERVELDTVRDTVFIDKIYYLTKEAPEKAADTIYLAPLEDSAYVYRDTLNDDNIKISYETITQAPILALDLSYQIIRPFELRTEITKTKYIAPQGFFTGAALNYDPSLGISYGPQVLYLTKKQNLYGLHYDINRKTISLGLAKRLF